MAGMVDSGDKSGRQESDRSSGDVKRRRQVLLFVPKPTDSQPYLKLLEEEGVDVLLAEKRETVETLLITASLRTDLIAHILQDGR